MNKFIKVAILAFFLSSGTIYLFNNFVSTYNKEIQNTQDKLRGVAFTKKTQALILDLQLLRGLSQFDENEFVEQNTIFEEANIQTLKHNIKQEVNDLRDFFIQNSFLEVKGYDYILNDIQNLADSSKNSSSLTYQKVTYLIEQLKEQMYHIGFKSKLLLEIDSNKYFLTDMLLRHLPSFMEIVGQIRAKTTRSIVENNTDANIRYSLQSSCLLCQEYQGLVRRTLNDLNDGENKIRLLTMLDDSEAQTKKMQEFVKQTLGASDISSLNPFEFFSLATSTIDKINELYVLSADILSNSLESKLQELNREKYYGIAIGAFVVIVIIIVLISTIRNYMLYMKSENRIKNNLTSIIELKLELEKCSGVDEISSSALYFFAQKFGIVNGAIYLFNEENSKLYLASSFATNEMKPIVELGEGLVGEVGIQKKYIHTTNGADDRKTLNIEEITLTPNHICTLPLMSHDRLFGVLQVGLLQSSNIVHNDDFTYYIDMIIGFLRDAKNQEIAKRYIELIDKHVITSSSNKDGIITNVSEAFSKISGYAKEELIGKSHSIVSSPDTPDEFYSQMWSTITKGSIFKGEVKNIDKHKQPYWVYLTITPQFDRYGNILGYSSIFKDITDRKRIEYFSITDALTSLYNRRFFDENFDKELRIAKRDKKPLALLVVDIDFFKQYNDLYGHIKGDEALKKVAKTMKKLFKRANDYVYRLGGEEFAISFSLLSQEALLLRAELLRESILELAIEHNGSSVSKNLSISIGGVFIENGCKLDSKEIYKLGDQALYRAKKEGRNRVVLADIS